MGRIYSSKSKQFIELAVLVAASVVAVVALLGTAVLASPNRVTAAPAGASTVEHARVRVEANAGDTSGEEREATVAHAAALTGSCGVERWSVKTGTDADAGQINTSSSTPTTISALTTLPQPSSLPANNRLAPTETTEFQVRATLDEFKLESDSDYHLVLDDGNGHTMLAEIPDPSCVGASSPLLSGIQNARGQFDAKYTASTSFQTVHAPVTVTGVGFFDFLHGQTGVAPNGIELHAVTDIQFN
jgi:hypothetical protein